MEKCVFTELLQNEYSCVDTSKINLTSPSHLLGAPHPAVTPNSKTSPSLL